MLFLSITPKCGQYIQLCTPAGLQWCSQRLLNAILLWNIKHEARTMRAKSKRELGFSWGLICSAWSIPWLYLRQQTSSSVSVYCVWYLEMRRRKRRCLLGTLLRSSSCIKYLILKGLRSTGHQELKRRRSHFCPWNPQSRCTLSIV